VTPTCTAFDASRRLASGAYLEVALAIKALQRERPERMVLVFDDTTGGQIDFDLRGTEQDVARRLDVGATAGDAAPPRDASPHGHSPRGPGRPRLGVVAREVTLLPRHWEWLNRQSGGASGALRRLVDAARTEKSHVDRVQKAKAAADRFMMAMAGDLPRYEDAARALYAGNKKHFDECTQNWPVDIRTHSRWLAVDAFAGFGLQELI
jgi:uncharacterized protein